MASVYVWQESLVYRSPCRLLSTGHSAASFVSPITAYTWIKLEKTKWTEQQERLYKNDLGGTAGQERLLFSTKDSDTGTLAGTAAVQNQGQRHRDTSWLLNPPLVIRDAEAVQDSILRVDAMCTMPQEYH